MWENKLYFFSFFYLWILLYASSVRSLSFSNLASLTSAASAIANSFQESMSNASKETGDASVPSSMKYDVNVHVGNSLENYAKSPVYDSMTVGSDGTLLFSTQQSALPNLVLKVSNLSDVMPVPSSIKLLDTAMKTKSGTESGSVPSSKSFPRSSSQNENGWYYFCVSDGSLLTFYISSRDKDALDNAHSRIKLTPSAYAGIAGLISQFCLNLHQRQDFQDLEAALVRKLISCLI